jgi:hypothetical protein
MENKYHPLTEQEFNEISEFILNLGAYLPDNKTSWIWSTFNKLRDENETMPCTCASAAGHWKRAVDHIHRWVKERI